MLSLHSSKFQLVDHENTGRIDFSTIADDITVILFFGATQNSVPRSYTLAAKRLGDRYLEIDIAGQGKNALDFHIAFYLGEILTQNPKAECTILSNDKGFDPLIVHLRERGLAVSRQATKLPATKNQPPRSVAQKFNPDILTPHAQEAYQFLLATQKPKRPRKRKSLSNHLFSHFRNKLTEPATQQLVAELISKSAVSENNQSITYHF